MEKLANLVHLFYGRVPVQHVDWSTLLGWTWLTHLHERCQFTYIFLANRQSRDLNNVEVWIVSSFPRFPSLPVPFPGFGNRSTCTNHNWHHRHPNFQQFSQLPGKVSVLVSISGSLFFTQSTSLFLRQVVFLFFSFFFFLLIISWSSVLSWTDSGLYI